MVWQLLTQAWGGDGSGCALSGGEKALLAGCWWDVITLRRPPEPDEQDGYPDREFECVLVMPDGKDGLRTDIPLVVMPHGGPHGNTPACFNYMRALLVAKGYACAAVNYRGSTGFGEDFVDCLPGRCGTLEVRDCHYAARTLLDLHQSLDATRVFVCGGSHGGYIGAHLAGQYPDFYRGFSLLNPVLDMGAMTAISDIPDWCYVEALGRRYTPYTPLSPLDADRMLRASPINFAHKVRAPVLLNVSEADLRVAPHYARYRDVLRANGVRCVVRRYPASNHALTEVDADADFVLGTVRFFDTV